MLGADNNAMTNARYFVIRAMGSGTTFFHGMFFIGGRSILEYLFVIVIIACTAMGCLRGGEGSGSFAAFLGVVVILFGLRHNALGFLAGISFERALFWHKLMAISTLVVSVVHAFLAGYSTSGLLLLLCMGIASVIYAVKQYNFEVFYYFHVLCNVGIIVFAYMHGVPLLVYAEAIWGADLLVRYLLSTSRVDATLEALPADVVRISFPKGKFKYCAGQYCFVMIPELGMLDFHPFTISSAPHEPNVKFHIRALGDWTKRLYQLVENKSKDLGDGLEGVKMTVHVEGPFGIPSVDFENEDTAKVTLLVTGGIGVTPAQSLFNHYVHQYAEEGRNIRKCIYIWSVKDRAMIKSVDHGRTSSVGAKKGKKEVLPQSFQPNLLNFFGTRQHVVTVAPDEEGAVAPMEVGEDTNPNRNIMKQQSSFSFSDDTLDSLDPFHVEFFLTSVRDKEGFAAANIDPEVQPYVKFGRPDLPKKWRAVAEMCVREGIPRVSVLVCGPAPMVAQVADLCRTKLTVTTKDDKGNPVTGSVIFDLHMEEFDF